MTKRRSFEQIDYTLRPSKQVERKLIIEILLALRSAGYDISKYNYLGLGSVFYVDFILFHKFLNINQMTCIEKENIENRMKFNKPYEFIDLIMCSISDFVPKINSDLQHFVWLDYDGSLTPEDLEDAANLFVNLKDGSFIIITVNAEIDSYRPKDIDFTKMDIPGIRKEIAKNLENQFGEHVGSIEKKNLTRKNFPKVLARIFDSQLKSTLVSRLDDRFLQLVNFTYQDGAKMITFGGLLDHKNKILDLKTSNIFDPISVNTNLIPFEISIPPLTPHEKHWINQNLDSINNKVKQIELEIPQILLKNYLKFYKHCPAFHEIIL